MQTPHSGRARPSLLARLALIGASLMLPAWAQAQALPALPAPSAWAGLLAPWLDGMVLALALVLALLTRLHRQNRNLLTPAALMGLWALYALLGRWPDPTDSVRVMRTALLALQLMGLAHYLLDRAGWRRGWLDAALWLQVMVAAVSHAAAPAALQPWLSQGWALLLALQALTLLTWSSGLRAKATISAAALTPELELSEQRGLKRLALAGALALALVLLLRLALGAEALLLARLAAPLWLVGLGLLAVQIGASGRAEAEAQLLALEQQQQEQLATMERSYAEMAEQRLEQVTERERKRIAADLHDDLGAKLLTIVHTSESDRISTLAREALEEMRLSVRGLTGKPVHLLDALGDWRAEVVSRLGQANILAEWKSPAEEISHTLPARAYVQTTRILRESVSNIIKHSGATHCTVSCAVQDGDFQVLIQDNGQGISTELDGRLDKGHGMASMKSRAKQMHGQCLVESGPGWGTVIRLTIPL